MRTPILAKEYKTARVTTVELVDLYKRFASKKRKDYLYKDDVESWVKTSRKLKDYYMGKEIEIKPEGTCNYCWKGEFHYEDICGNINKLK